MAAKKTTVQKTVEAVIVTQELPQIQLPVIKPEINNTLAVLQVIERCANDPNVDIEKMQKLLDMQERIMNKQQEIEYNIAFSEMQPKLPPIPALGEGHNNARFAKKEDMNQLVNPILSKFGFALSFKNTQENGTIKTRATLRHRAGHAEFTEITLKDDNSGSKNAVQAVGSSQSYGERYTMKAILNLTIIKDPTDDDAASASDIKNKGKSKSSVKFQEKVNADSKKNSSKPVEKAEVWNGKDIIFSGGTRTIDFENEIAGAQFLYDEMKKIPKKELRLKTISLNQSLINALIKIKRADIIESFHKLASKGE